MWVGVLVVVVDGGGSSPAPCSGRGPYEVEILGPWAGFSMPSLPMTVLSAFLVSTLYALVPAGRARTIGKWVVLGLLSSPPSRGSTSPRTIRPTSSPA